jgi:phosphoglycolate phosphatase
MNVMAGKFIIFDLDGTLIDSSEGVVEATNYALEKVGEPVRSHEEIVPYIGFPLSRMFADFTSAPYDELARHFQVRARQTVVGSTVPLPGVDDVLRWLHENEYRAAIATTKVSLHIDLILQKCNWADYFDATVGGDEVTEVKPAPDAFLLALERLNAKPHSTVAVGDTINDIFAARTIGLTSVAVKSPYGDSRPLREANPSYYIDSLGDLPGILAKHFGDTKE